VPEFQEQLIPLHIRNLYNITTATPLCGTPSPSPEIYTPAFEIVDSTPKSIRAALTALGVQGKSDLENKRTLERLVHAQGKKLVYLQDEQVKAAAKPKKEKRKIKASKAARTGLCDERAVPPSDIA
jgi:hypothetical protein